MPREYFPSKFHLDNRLRYFLWSTDISGDDVDRDEIWTHNGIAPTFATLDEVRAFAHNEVGVSFAQEGEPLLHELDWVARWLRLSKQNRSRQMRVSQSLQAWNIFSDLARSLRVPFSGDSEALTPLWTKQFFGDSQKSNNSPYLSGNELQITHNILSEGLLLWRKHVH